MLKKDEVINKHNLIKNKVEKEKHENLAFDESDIVKIMTGMLFGVDLYEYEI